MTGSRWTPERKDEFLRVSWGSNRFQLVLEILNPGDSGWLLGKMWSPFLQRSYKDMGVLVQIIKTVPQAPQAVGPNLVLNPQTPNL